MPEDNQQHDEEESTLTIYNFEPYYSKQLIRNKLYTVIHQVFDFDVSFQSFSEYTADSSINSSE